MTPAGVIQRLRPETGEKMGRMPSIQGTLAVA